MGKPVTGPLLIQVIIRKPVTYNYRKIIYPTYLLSKRVKIILVEKKLISPLQPLL
jgi:hypothetical protein